MSSVMKRAPANLSKCSFPAVKSTQTTECESDDTYELELHSKWFRERESSFHHLNSNYPVDDAAVSRAPIGPCDHATWPVLHVWTKLMEHVGLWAGHVSTLSPRYDGHMITARSRDLPARQDTATYQQWLGLLTYRKRRFSFPRVTNKGDSRESLSLSPWREWLLVPPWTNQFSVTALPSTAIFDLLWCF